MESRSPAPGSTSTKPLVASSFGDISTTDTSFAVSSTAQLAEQDPSRLAAHTATTTTSLEPRYSVFISHAGEDKTTIAFPLRKRLREEGITAFVDNADMPCGTESTQAMTQAMETARIGVFVLSPEFVMKKWPMRELMCFLNRHEKYSSGGQKGPDKPPTIIPFFYRLSVSDMYNEPNFSRRDKDGVLLCEKTRFFSRMKNDEPESQLKNVEKALQALHNMMGLENFVDANNDSTTSMQDRRDVLIEKLCDKIWESLPVGIRPQRSSKKSRRDSRDTLLADSFQQSFPPKLIGKTVVLDFDSQDGQGLPTTAEGHVKRCLLEQKNRAPGIVALYGLGGVGKSTILEALMSDDDARSRFSDGVYLIRLGSDATRNTFFQRICYILEQSGAVNYPQYLRERYDLEGMLDFFVTWFEGRSCAFFIDDVWEHSINVRALSRLCDVTRIEGGNRVLITTREMNMASLTCDANIITLYPKDSRGEVARKILFFHAGIAENHTAITDAEVPISEVLDICAGLPVRLAVVGKSVRRFCPIGQKCRTNVWASYLSRLRACHNTLLRQEFGSYGRLCTTFATSLRFLDEKSPEERVGFESKFSFAEMHRRLCVLQRQVAVPATMLMHLWGNESEESAEMIATMFADVGLAGRKAVQGGSELESRLVLHDSIHEFVLSEARRHGEIADAHNLMLNNYSSGLEEVSPGSDDKKVIWWSRGLKDDGYIHKHLCRHLAKGGRKKELCSLLLTPLWAERQMEVNGFMFLEDDFRTGMTEIDENEETKEALRLIANAVSLSSVQVLRNNTELWFQLHGRLKGYVIGNRVIGKYVECIENYPAKPRVLSVNGFLVGGRNRKKLSVESGVVCMALFPDEERVACGCSDGSLVIVNIRKSEMERKWEVHRDDNKGIRSIAVAQNGTQIVTMSLESKDKHGSTQLDLWDVDSGQHVGRTRGHPDQVNCFAITHDEICVVSVSRKGSLQLCDLRTSELVVPETNVGPGVTGIVILKDGVRAITGYRSGKLKMWNIRTGEQLCEFSEGTDGVIDVVEVTPDERRLLSGSYDGKVKIWDLGSRQHIWNSQHHAEIVSLAVSTDGRRIALCDEESAIQIWDVESGDQVCEHILGHAAPIKGISFLKHSKDAILSYSVDGTLRMWDITREENKNYFDRHENAVVGVSFTPNGKGVVTGSTDSTLRIWDATAGQAKNSPLVIHSPSYFVKDVAVTADGRYAVTVSTDTKVCVWDPKTRKLLHEFKGHTKAVNCVAVTQKGDRAVTGSEDGTVLVWDMETKDGGNIVLEGHNNSIERVFVSDDGLRVVSVAGDDVFVWNLVWDMKEMKDMKEPATRSSKVTGAANMSRREVFSFINEHTDHDDAGLSIRLGSREIIHEEGSKARVLATLESNVKSWDISPDKKTICLGLEDGVVAFLKVDV